MLSGNIIDPVTGKRVIAGTFSDEMELKAKLVEQIVDEPLQEVRMGLLV